MGWTGTPCDSKPSNREINRMVQQWMETPTCRIIDRSEWQAHGRHQFLLMEAEPRVETEKAIRFIVVILVEYHQHHPVASCKPRTGARLPERYKDTRRGCRLLPTQRRPKW